MCHATKCRDCGKATWAGCGMHVASAMRGVADENRCSNWKLGARQPCGQAKSTTQQEESTVRSAWSPSSWFNNK